jgi:hypothetical protein
LNSLIWGRFFCLSANHGDSIPGFGIAPPLFAGQFLRVHYGRQTFFDKARDFFSFMSQSILFREYGMYFYRLNISTRMAENQVRLRAHKQGGMWIFFVKDAN